MTRVSFECNSYDVTIDEKTNNVSQIKIRQNNSTIFNLVKYLAIFTLSLFILDFFLDLGENVASIFTSGSTLSGPIISTETVQTGGGATVSFIRSLGKYILALLCIVLYFYSFEWATLSDEEFKKLSSNKLFLDALKSSDKPKETKSVETPKSTSDSKDTTSANTTTNATIPVASVPTTPVSTAVSTTPATTTASTSTTASTQQSTLPTGTEPAPAVTTTAKLQSSSLEGKKETFEDYALDGYAPYNSDIEYASY